MRALHQNFLYVGGAAGAADYAGEGIVIEESFLGSAAQSRC